MLEISTDEIIDSLRGENPWWDEGKIDERYASLPRRSYYDQFFKLVTERRVRRAVVLMGPRRVGKTVMIHHAVQGLIEAGVNPKTILYVSIDTPTYTGMPLERYLRFLREQNAIGRKEEVYILFDEVQYLKDWEQHLKVLVDKHPNANFVASGSAAAALKLASQESGAGRFTDFMLPPLTFAEYLKFIGREDELIRVVENEDQPELETAQAIDIVELNREFINYLNYGGYPEAVFSDLARANPARYIKSDIIDKVLLRDLPVLYGITNIQELNKLFTSIAYNTGNAISLDGLSKSSGVSKPTIIRYIEYLEAAFLIARVKRIDEKCSSFAREREFKVYLTNPSMRAALFHPITDSSEAMGNLAETAVFAQWFHSTIFNTLFYARWKRSGRSKNGSDNYGEVDLVSVRPGQGPPDWVVEIKWTDRFFHNPRELEGLVEFLRKNDLLLAEFGQAPALVTTKTKSGRKSINGTDVEFLPCALHCYLVGKNTVQSKYRSGLSSASPGPDDDALIKDF